MDNDFQVQRSKQWQRPESWGKKWLGSSLYMIKEILGKAHNKKFQKLSRKLIK